MLREVNWTLIQSSCSAAAGLPWPSCRQWEEYKVCGVIKSVALQRSRLGWCWPSSVTRATWVKVWMTVKPPWDESDSWWCWGLSGAHSILHSPFKAFVSWTFLCSEKYPLAYKDDLRCLTVNTGWTHLCVDQFEMCRDVIIDDPQQQAFLCLSHWSLNDVM